MTNTPESGFLTVQGAMQSNKDTANDYARTSWAEIQHLMEHPQTVAKAEAKAVIMSTTVAPMAREASYQANHGHYGAMCFDVDEGNLAADTIINTITKIFGTLPRLMLYSTKSSTADNRKWRGFVALEATIAGADYSYAQEAFLDALEFAGICSDRSAERLGQLHFLPNRGEHYEFHNVGEQPLALGPLHPMWAKVERLKLAAQQRHTAATGAGAFIWAFAKVHDTAALLAAYGYTQRHANSPHWRSPYQTSPSFATRVYDDGGWHSLSDSDNALGLTAGDAFDLFKHYDQRFEGKTKAEVDKLALAYCKTLIYGSATVAHGQALWTAYLAAEAARAEAARVAAEALTAAAVERGDTAIYGQAFKFGTEETKSMQYLIDPWLPKGIVVGLYGRGESGKSTWASTLCAQASNQVSTLWVTSEEEEANVAVRYTKSGGQPETISVSTYMIKKVIEPNRVIFDAYEHLEEMIVDLQPNCQPNRPLGIVVLDAVATLVTWGKGENANDDRSVKRLLAHLTNIAERHQITILIIGHMNKNTNKTHGADAVTGSASWTNSVRRAFMFYKDVASENEYDFFVRTAKANTGTHFASAYSTEVVHTIHERKGLDGACDEVLCRTVLSDAGIAWGEHQINKLIHDSDEEDPNHEAKQRRMSKKDAMREAIANAIREGGCTTRAAVIEHLGGAKISRRAWTQIDTFLELNCGIRIVKGERGVNQYS